MPFTTRFAIAHGLMEILRDYHIKNTAAILLVLALVFAQIATSSHAHDYNYDYDTTFETAAYHDAVTVHAHIDGGDNNSEDRPHECPECLLTKSLQKTVPQGVFLYSALSGTEFPQPIYTSAFVPYEGTKIYRARAPPAFLV